MMLKVLRFSTALCLTALCSFCLIACVPGSDSVGAPVGSPSPSLSPSPVSSGSPVATQVTQVEESITPAAAKTLMIEFGRAQVTQMKALKHRNQFEYKEFLSTQDFKFKDWKKKEQATRLRFFDEHTSGVERRDYVKSYREKLDARFKEMAFEKSKKSSELELKLNELQNEQVKRLEQVKKLLESGKRPAANLWPQSGS